MDDQNKLKGIRKVITPNVDTGEWERKMHREKGKKVFSNVKHPMVKAKVVRLTEWQFKLIDNYCNAKGRTFSDMVRLSFAKMIREDGYMQQLSEADKRQLQLFE